MGKYNIGIAVYDFFNQPNCLPIYAAKIYFKIRIVIVRYLLVVHENYMDYLLQFGRISQFNDFIV